MIQGAWDKPSKTALIFEKSSYTFLDLCNLVDELEKNLNQAGINSFSGLKISSDIDNTVLSIILLLFSARNGSFYCPLNADLTPVQLDKQLSILKPNLHISFEEKFHRYPSRFNLVESGHIISFTSAKIFYGCAPEKKKRINSLWNTDFLLTSSSGSTGNPKLIVFSQETKFRRSLSAIEQWNLKKDDVILNASPIHHSLGQRLSLLPLILGATQVLLPKFNVQRWIHAVRTYGVTFTIPVSPHLMQLSKDSQISNLLSSTSIRCLVSSSASLDGAFKKALTDSKQHLFHEMYGASEIGTATVITYPTQKDTSVGKAIKGVTLKIVDIDTLKEVSAGIIGEIYVKSEFSFTGYYNDPLLTKEVYQNKYFATGDLGYLDDQGYLYFKGRKNECMKVGGINVYCSDILKCIEDLGVKYNMLVLPVKDSLLGNRPVVVLETQLVERELKFFEKLSRQIRAHCALNLAAYQMPIKILTIDLFPKLSNGKYNIMLLTRMVQAAIDKNEWHVV